MQVGFMAWPLIMIFAMITATPFAAVGSTVPGLPIAA